jgi:hypothetical protein
MGHPPSIGRKRQLVADSASGASPPSPLGPRALQPSPKPIPPGVLCEVALGWAVRRSWSPSATEIELPASVAAEPRVGSCGDERLAAGLADNLVMLEAATLPGAGVEQPP